MTHQEMDVLFMGAALGGMLGMWLGYVLRGLRERVRDHHEEIREINRPRMPTFVSLPRHEQKRQRIAVVKPMNDSNRDDVIAVLTGAGYKKATAISAVDACLAHERSTVESWAAAAFSKALR